MTTAGQELRARLGADDHDLDWVRTAAGLDPSLEHMPGVPIAGEDLLWTLTASTIMPEQDPGLDPEAQADLLMLEPADWIGAIVEMVRAGAGSPADPATLVEHINRCPEVDGPPIDPDDAVLVEHAFEVRMPAWQALGIVDADRRLTEAGAFLLPRAACTAWESDFDFPDDRSDDPFGDNPFALEGSDGDEDDVAPEVAELATDFALWCQDTGVAADDDWVATLLDLRFTYLDDDLTSWRQDDLRELLIEICPRKLSVDPGEMREALTSLATFLDFLADIGLDERSDPVETLTAWIRHATDTVMAAMEDESRWGPAKALGAAVEADGVDITDRAAVEAWMADFNDRPIDERDAVLGRIGPAADLPMLFLPDEDELSQLVRSTLLWQQVTGLITYVGDRLPVTDAGNLKLADARKLVEQLDTGDVFDPPSPFGGPVKTRSSQELGGLSRTFELAKAVGLLVQQGRNIRPDAARVAEFRDAPVAIWEEMVADWLRHGFLTSLYAGYAVWWAGELDSLVLDTLITLVEADQPLPLDRLADLLAEESPYPAMRGQAIADRLRDDVHRWAQQLEVAGLVEVHGMRTSRSRGAMIYRQRGKLTATPLTPLLLARVAGAVVHRQGALREADAATLLDTAVELPVEAAEAEVATWLADRTPEAAADELGAVLSGAPRERIIGAFLAFDLLGASARTAVERLQQDVNAGPIA